MEFKGTKSAADYIETVYGTGRFAITIYVNDASNIMDLMQDFSDYNLKKSKAPEMLEMLKMHIYALDNGPLKFFDKYGFNVSELSDRCRILIKEATEI